MHLDTRSVSAGHEATHEVYGVHAITASAHACKLVLPPEACSGMLSALLQGRMPRQVTQVCSTCAMVHLCKRDMSTPCSTSEEPAGLTSSSTATGCISGSDGFAVPQRTVSLGREHGAPCSMTSAADMQQAATVCRQMLQRISAVSRAQLHVESCMGSRGQQSQDRQAIQVST